MDLRGSFVGLCPFHGKALVFSLFSETLQFLGLFRYETRLFLDMFQGTNVFLGFKHSMDVSILAES